MHRSFSMARRNQAPAAPAKARPCALARHCSKPWPPTQPRAAQQKPRCSRLWWLGLPPSCMHCSSSGTDDYGGAICIACEIGA